MSEHVAENFSILLKSRGASDTSLHAVRQVYLVAPCKKRAYWHVVGIIKPVFYISFAFFMPLTGRRIISRWNDENTKLTKFRNNQSQMNNNLSGLLNFYILSIEILVKFSYFIWFYKTRESIIDENIAIINCGENKMNIKAIKIANMQLIQLIIILKFGYFLYKP